MEARQLSGELHNRIVECLKSLPTNLESSERQALINSAGFDEELYNNIHIEGPRGEFFHNLIPNLAKYGSLRDGRDALEALLTAAKNLCGLEGKSELDRLIQEWQNVKEVAVDEKEKKEEEVEVRESSATLIPGYQYDIFISYCTDDSRKWDKALTILKGYVETACKTDFDNRTPRYVEYTEWTLEAKKSAENSAAVVVIYSQQYQASSWERTGDKAFLNMLDQRMEQEGKIFLLTLDQAEYPDSLCRATICSLTCDTPEQCTFPESRNKLSDLGWDISAGLRQLQKHADAKQHGYRGVIIDHADKDQQLAENLARKLKKLGVEYILEIVSTADRPSERRGTFGNNVLYSYGVVLIYSPTTSNWYFDEVRRLCEILAKQPSLPVFAIYDGPPPRPGQPGAFLDPPRWIHIIDCRACQKLDQACDQCSGNSKNSGKRALLEFVDKLKRKHAYA